ncbi:MAG: response regulator [Rhodospirillales bacterium]|jgi:two-component system, chemotaxis family, chemotaxis protein CheY|nr:response regulator [Rhodospirillales bacterium]
MAEKTSIGGMNILVADDNDAFRIVMRTVMNALGISNVKFVNDAPKALEAANTGKFDAMIIERDLNNKSGLKLVKFLRASAKSNDPLLPVIMMAANWEYPQIVAARDAGVNEYLAKPFSQGQMQKRLEAVHTKPRPFIKDDDFFGPDRRRKTGPELKAKERRLIEPEFLKREDMKKSIDDFDLF